MKTNKSFLNFYSIDDQIDGLSYKEVWDKYIINREADRACKNIYEFHTSVENLIKSLKNPSKVNPSLLAYIKAEYSNGADFMFITPIAGEPIEGFHIASYLQ